MTEVDPGELAPPPPPPSDEGATKPPGRQRRSEWRRTEKARRYAARNSVRFPIFTRSVLLWMLIFALVGVAFGASGAFWWAHFNTQVSELRSDTQDFETRSQSASADIEKQKNDATAEINAALEPLKDSLAATKTVQQAAIFSPAVYQVSTLDDQGRPSVGTAFAVITSDNESLMLTSFNTIRAASVNPGPPITLSKGTDQIPASLVNWDPANDLALLRVQRGNINVLDWASDDVLKTALGATVFPVSGTGGAGATLTSGTLIDQSAAGFQHTAPLGFDFQGGPIVNGDGKVLGIASLAYLPLGYDNGQIHYSPPISAACARVLNCTGGNRVAGANGG
jgi:S1-C subfamily serine protease